jgi:hypothetical protein
MTAALYPSPATVAGPCLLQLVLAPTHVMRYNAGARGRLGPGGLPGLQNQCGARRASQVGSTPMRSRQYSQDTRQHGHAVYICVPVLSCVLAAVPPYSGSLP